MKELFSRQRYNQQSRHILPYPSKAQQSQARFNPGRLRRPVGSQCGNPQSASASRKTAAAACFSKPAWHIEPHTMQHENEPALAFCGGTVRSSRLGKAATSPYRQQRASCELQRNAAEQPREWSSRIRGDGSYGKLDTEPEMPLVR